MAQDITVRLLTANKTEKLTQQDFRGQGGQASVYVKGQVAYKIYLDKNFVIPTQKFKELAVLQRPEIVRPMDMLLDAAGVPIGYAMRYIDDTICLSQTFPKAFRDRTSFTPAHAAHLVQKMREITQYIHDQGILIVDGNENNYLVKNKDFADIFFIDVDSYQTANYPAQAILDTVRDRHMKSAHFTKDTDWFTFAVVAFMTFIGIHPFKGKHPKLKTLDERMKANISALNKDVILPPVVQPFSVIPAAYRDWFEQVFEKGVRCPPPDWIDSKTIIQAPKLKLTVQGVTLDISEVLDASDNILWHVDGFTLTHTGLYNEVQKQIDTFSGDQMFVATTGNKNHIAFNLAGPKMHDSHWKVGAWHVEQQRKLTCDLWADELAMAGGRVLFRRGDGVFEITTAEMGTGATANVLIGAQRLANVLPNSTTLYDGMAIQNMLGSVYTSLFPSSKKHFQLHTPQFEGARVMSARYENKVAVVIFQRRGQFKRAILRFSADYQQYDYREYDIDLAVEPNFTVLDNGLCVSMVEDGLLLLFPNLINSDNVKVLRDNAIDLSFRLFHNGQVLMASRDNILYKLAMPKPDPNAQPTTGNAPAAGTAQPPLNANMANAAQAAGQATAAAVKRTRKKTTPAP